MKKQAIGVLLGGVTLFVWGMVSWMLLPWHDAVMKNLPQEQLISDTIKTVVPEPGLYFFPSDKIADGRMPPAAYVEKYKKGPIGLLIFSPQGHEPMGARTFLIGFLGDLFISFLVLFFLSLCRERVASVLGRVKVTMGLGLLVWVVAHVPYWNWFHFPLNYTLIMLFDTVVGFALLGWVVSKFVPE